jgi:hypothetical protein
MNLKRVLLVSILLIGASLLGYEWFGHVVRPKPVSCGYCMRPLQSNLRVTAEIDGKRAEVCCARCAITEANQKHKNLRLIAVRDHTKGKAIAPEGAWFVENSQAVACNHDAMRMDEMKDTQSLAFDRCSPGTFAFQNKADAEAFIARNGGSVLSYTELMREARYQ